MTADPARGPGGRGPGGRGRPAWMVDEMATIGRENVDPAHVARYDDKEDAEAAAEVAFLQVAGVPPSATVVELGAGTGQFALAAATTFARVVAVDPSPVMLDRLRAKARAATARSSARSPVEVVAGGFLSYEHRGAPADVVYSRLALHHLPDTWKAVALRRIREMLRPGGLLRLWDVVYDAEPGGLGELVEEWAATVPEVARHDGEWVRADIEEHVRDEHSTFRWLLEPMLARAGFGVAEAEHPDRVTAKYLLTAI